jgi:hypothetical protein
MADIERLDRALAHIEAHPEQHDQDVWLRDTTAGGKVDCGTAGCLAGWVVAQAHPEASFIRADDADKAPGACSRVEIEPGVVRPIEDYAQQLLDISKGQAVALFMPGNTVETLKGMRNILAAQPYATGTWMIDHAGICS